MPNRQVPRFRPCPGPAITATCPGTISGTSHQPVSRDRQLKQLGWRWFPALHPPGLDRLSELRAQRHQIRAAENDGGAVENLHAAYPMTTVRGWPAAWRSASILALLPASAPRTSAIAAS